MVQNNINKSVANIKHDLCCGCMMCGDACPKKAILFPLVKGFWYPEVREESCVNCGLCRKKCPVLNAPKKEADEPIACYGVKCKDEDVRWNSTSGGFFSVLAKYWIENGGIVVGAVYDENNTIIHFSGHNIADIDRLRQSKYAQSNTFGIYKEVKRLLNDGIKVLFCGTPCQIEALLSYLDKPYENLLTMDFVCLGICSPYVYQKYLGMLESKFHSKIKNVWFKNKEHGWRNIAVRIDFNNGKTYLKDGGYDMFMVPFVTDALSMRKNCENCKFRKLPHRSDFMVGDFWGVEKIYPAIDDNKGISALMVNSKNGIELFDKIKDNLDLFKTSWQDIVAGNFSILKPLPTNPKQEAFIDAIDVIGYKKAVYSFSTLNRMKIYKRKIRNFLSSVKNIRYKNG